jgi:hypothetical protein
LRIAGRRSRHLQVCRRHTGLRTRRHAQRDGDRRSFPVHIDGDVRREEPIGRYRFLRLSDRLRRERVEQALGHFGITLPAHEVDAGREDFSQRVRRHDVDAILECTRARRVRRFRSGRRCG